MALALRMTSHRFAEALAESLATADPFETAGSAAQCVNVGSPRGIGSMRTFTIAAVVVAVGFAAGAYAWFAGLPVATFRMGLALFLGVNLLIGLWAWARAKPGSADARLVPTTVLTTVGMLVGVVPGVLWPTSDRARVAGAVTSLIFLTGVLVMQFRRRRALR